MEYYKNVKNYSIGSSELGVADQKYLSKSKPLKLEFCWNILTMF